MRSDIPEIIVIDDAPNASNEYAELIEAQTGIKVKAFTMPEDVLDYVSHVNVKVAVLDQVMPNLHGTELFERIKEIDPNVKAIMLTGEASKEEVINAINVGFSTYLSKDKIMQLPAKVLDLFTQYEISISKDLQSKDNKRLFPIWKRILSPCYLVSCTPHGPLTVIGDGENILDILAGQEKEWNLSNSIENRIQIEAKIEQKLASELNFSAREIKHIAAVLNSTITAQSSKLFSFTIQQTNSQRQFYKIEQDKGAEPQVSRRVIEQFPVFQQYRIIIRKVCRICKQAKYLTFIVSKQTSKVKTIQTDHMSDNSTKTVDLGIHNISKIVTPR